MIYQKRFLNTHLVSPGDPFEYHGRMTAERPIVTSRLATRLVYFDCGLLWWSVVHSELPPYPPRFLNSNPPRFLNSKPDLPFYFPAFFFQQLGT